MRQYELMVIFMPSVDAADTKKINSLVTRVLGTQPFTITSTDILGKRRLSYMIRKQQEGVYVLVKLTSPALQLSVIEKQVRLTPEVMRYMVTLVKE